MTHTVIRYRTKPESTAENRRLAQAVFEELKSTAPEGIRYAALELEGGEFLHIVEYDEGAPSISSLHAFQRFSEDGESRRTEGPHRSAATMIGNYRMFSD